MNKRCGYVGIIGLPNSGKSTLLNNFLEDEYSIVSNKPQTTRRTFVGIHTGEDYQIVFLDAPGFVPGKPGMFEFLRSEFFRVVDDVDLLLVVLANDQEESGQFMAMWNAIKKAELPVALVVTKLDLDRSSFVDEFLTNEWTGGSSLFEVDNFHAEKGMFPFILGELAKQLPEQAGFYYEPDQVSPWNLRDLASEWLREACFANLEMEIPFGVGVRINSFKEEPKIVRVDATIIVDKENHKGIVIGNKGSMLRKIGQEAREKMERMLGQKVFLQTHVSTKKNWQKNQNIMKELGYGDQKS